MTIGSLFGTKNTTPHTRVQREGNPPKMPKVNADDARSVDAEVVDSGWADQADRVEPELNPEDYKAIDRNGKTVLEKKRNLGRKSPRKVLKTPSRRREQADRREQDAANLFTKGNGYANAVKGTSGWLRDYNGDGNISWGERFRSALEFVGKGFSILFTPGALLLATGICGTSLLAANLTTWIYVGSLNMIAIGVVVPAWAMLSAAQSWETMRSLGKRGAVQKLLRAAQTPSWLPKFNPDLNPQVYELLQEYQEGFEQPTNKLAGYRFLGLIVLELVILSSGLDAFAAGFSLIVMAGVVFSAAGAELCLRSYSQQLKDILSPEAKELEQKILDSMAVRGVKIV